MLATCSRDGRVIIYIYVLRERDRDRQRYKPGQPQLPVSFFALVTTNQCLGQF